MRDDVLRITNGVWRSVNRILPVEGGDMGYEEGGLLDTNINLLYW